MVRRNDPNGTLNRGPDSMKHSQSWLIGGDPRCDIVIDEPTVSGRHCRLGWTDEGFILEDLHSTNGTFVNGFRIEGPTNVTRADTIMLGRNVPMPWPKEDPHFASEPIRVTQPIPERPPLPAKALHSGPLPHPGRPHSGPLPVRETERSIRIGRLADNDVVLDYPDRFGPPRAHRLRARSNVDRGLRLAQRHGHRFAGETGSSGLGFRPTTWSISVRCESLRRSSWPAVWPWASSRTRP